MSATSPAALARGMIDTRRDLKALCAQLGVSYEEKVAQWRGIVTAVMKAHSCTEVRAVLRLEDELHAVGKFNAFVGALLVAAALDLIEERQAAEAAAQEAT